MSTNELASHVRDPARLAALHAVALLDTPTEESFDRLSRLAARFLIAPTALVTLVDADRQFFKSCIGLPEPWSSRRETPLSHSFCQHNRIAGQPLVIEDARTHPLFRSNLAIRELNVIAYLGIPLVTSDGYVLGSFCVIDSKPRHWTEEDVAVVRDLASSVMTEIQLRTEITAKHQAEGERDELSEMNMCLRKEISARRQAEMEKEKLQTQLLQAQKMEAVGHLAGGLAHDFNNILSAIVGYAHVTLIRMRDDDPLRVNLEHILSSSEKAANLTKSLLAVSRKQVMQFRPVNLNRIVAGMKTLLERIIGEDIHLRVHTTVDDLIVNAVANQLEQVILNLVTNARDAMPRGGTLTITTEVKEIDEHYVQTHLEGEAGTYALLSVMDTGLGMDEKSRQNIFVPFFTTKEAGKGSGLGLAMVYGSIKQHNGFINVYSEPGEGAIFRIYLPLSATDAAVPDEKDPTAIPSGTETVLLVEDNEDVRNATKTLLTEFGYSVIVAANGKEALELFSKNRDRIDVVIADIIMPGQSGRELHGELEKIEPDIKIIFISGYPADMLAGKGIIDPDVNFISKPVTPEVLFTTLREVLEG